MIRHRLSTLPLFALLLAGPARAQCQTDFVISSDWSSGDVFGDSVALDDPVLVVGKPQPSTPGASSDAAYVYERFGQGLSWTGTQRLAPSDFAFGQNFGEAVDVHGDLILVSDPGAEGEIFFSGKVYAFENTGSAWIETGVLQATVGKYGSQFGHAIDLSSDGQLAIVGAPYEDDEGAAYVFRRFGSQWTQEARLSPSDAAVTGDSLFGWEVAIDGDVAVVGDWFHSGLGPGSGPTKGSVYVFERDAEGWTETVRLFGPGTVAGDSFGLDLDLDGDRLAVGAPKGGPSGPTVFTPGPGRVFVYERGALGWSLDGVLTTADLEPSFGQSVAVDGDRLVSGAHLANDGNGIAYAFERSEAGWKETGRVGPWKTVSDGAGLGTAVALDGDLAAVAAPFQNNPHGIEGRCYLVDLAFETTLESSVSAISVAAGGSQPLVLQACPTFPSFVGYLVLGSLTTGGAGIDVDGLNLPLEPDEYFLFSLTSPNTAPLSNTNGFLPPTGLVVASVDVPAGLPPALVGTTVHHAALTYRLVELGLLAVDAVSNAVSLELAP